ncbi:MAG: DUF3347 domain-containing protein, partial [Planctomycetota bacterium]|jgi:Cu(I)/Ag(I) efflux system membrane fusion protein
MMKGYLEIGEALAGDDFDRARQSVTGLSEVVAKEDVGETPESWASAMKDMAALVEPLTKAGGIEPVRKAFAPISEELAMMARVFGADLSGSLYEAKCPMAFNNRGATWLQAETILANPYFGAQMLRCGEVIATLNEAKTKKAPAEDDTQQGADARSIYDGYLKLSAALVVTDLAQTQQGVKALRELVGKPGPGDKLAPLSAPLEAMGNAEDIEAIRVAFEPLTKATLAYVRDHTEGLNRSVYRVHCPMAFNNKGADWLHEEPAVLNPYFGDRMLKCGMVVEKVLVVEKATGGAK